MSSADIINFYLGCEHYVFNPEDPYYKYSPKDYFPVKQVAIIPNIEELSHIAPLLKNSPYLNMIPIADYRGALYALLFRSAHGSDKRFSFVALAPLITYGLEGMKDFKYGDLLIICEGVKDNWAIRNFHPYVLSYLTAFPPVNLLSFYRKITNNLILVSDNDKSTRRIKKICQEHRVRQECLPEKDPGVYLEEGRLNELSAYINSYLTSSELEL